MVYINYNLSFVWFICVPARCWISYSWCLDCFSKFFQAQSVAVPDLAVSNSSFYFWVYIAGHCSEIHLPLLLWVSQVCPMLLSAKQILVLTTLAPCPQHISTIHQDEVVTALGNLHAPCPNSTPWCFSTILFFFLHCTLAVPFLHMLKPKQLSSSLSNIQTKCHWNSFSLLHLEKLQYFLLN